MAPSETTTTQVGFTSASSHKDSNLWATIKPGLVFGLKATEKALDGLPIPGAKGCVSLILHFLETANLAAENAEVLQALQRQYEALQSVLWPVYADKAFDVPDDVRKDVGDLSMKLDELATEWRPKLEKKQKKRFFFLRLLKASDDHGMLTRFANAVEQTIQNFLVITATNGRIAAYKEVIRDREDRMLERLPRAPTASYNSIRTGGANVCMNGTRVSILKTIREWARNPDPNQPPMFWLNGLAGIGKTTIAHSIASELDADGLLGASFVFLRADEQLKDARLVFPTLAFQLAQFNSQFRTRLVTALKRDPDCGSKRLNLQFDSLILEVFEATSLSAPVVIILDALDECEPKKLTSELLRILHQNIRSVPFLRVFVTSRPEGYIREALTLVDSSSPHRKLVLHEDIHAAEVESDIRLFLQLHLQEIWDERAKQTAVRWPSEGDLEKLVKLSGKLFVYAATAVRFIGGNRALNINRQLSTLLNVKIGQVPHGEPYQQLDGLYLQILASVFADSGDEYYIQRFRKIVGSIVLLERPLPLGPLANFLGDCSVEDITETLYHLHSIIIVPATNSDAPRAYHLSFPNFITNSDRCTNLTSYIDPGQQAKFLFHRCLDVIERSFRPITSNSLDEDIDQIQSAIPLQDANVAEPIISHAAELGVGDGHSELFHGSELSHSTELSHSLVDEDDSEDHSLSPEIRYSENYWCRHLMNIPTNNQESAIALERFILRYLPKWLQRRMARILDDFDNPNIRLAGDTFDIIHNAYHWGSQSGCSNQFQVFLQEKARLLFAQLFPDARFVYSFGKRLNIRGLRPRSRPNNISPYTFTPLASHGQGPWVAWHPDPNRSMTPSSSGPVSLVVPRSSSPGLFGPRTESDASLNNSVFHDPSHQPGRGLWVARHPDPNHSMTPPSIEPVSLVVPRPRSPGLFGPRTESDASLNNSVFRDPSYQPSRRVGHSFGNRLNIRGLRPRSQPNNTSPYTSTPLASHGQGPWVAWHPDPNRSMTPSSSGPVSLVVPRSSSPGLFGPRTESDASLNNYR
ncbi:hypothetical protein D9619_009683 [Psilocybe cf. subviscida]|uniref:NACHT domain-containing protein n=1 Tax=Psilocybe cf. subviscida TaxID=2480587 RepID=A0A8H5F6Q6_9AGAR|nr:hypothetical protein D9619_009683 [Psilocybe cf. subviscida]